MLKRIFLVLLVVITLCYVAPVAAWDDAWDDVYNPCPWSPEDPNTLKPNDEELNKKKLDEDRKNDFKNNHRFDSVENCLDTGVDQIKQSIYNAPDNFVYNVKHIGMGIKNVSGKVMQYLADCNEEEDKNYNETHPVTMQQLKDVGNGIASLPKKFVEYSNEITKSERKVLTYLQLELGLFDGSDPEPEDLLDCLGGLILVNVGITAQTFFYNFLDYYHIFIIQGDVANQITNLCLGSFVTLAGLVAIWCMDYGVYKIWEKDPHAFDGLEETYNWYDYP